MADNAEIELTFETDPSFTLPDLSDLPGVATVARPEERQQRRRGDGSGTTGQDGSRHASTPTGRGPEEAGPRLRLPVGSRQVVTRGTPSRRRVAGQRAGASRWHS